MNDNKEYQTSLDICSVSPDLQIVLSHKWFKYTGRGGSAEKCHHAADTNDFHMNTLLPNDWRRCAQEISWYRFK